MSLNPIPNNLNHPMRVVLAAEAHSRPFLRLDAPELVSHLAVYLRPEREMSGDRPVNQHGILASLCAHFQVQPPAKEVNHFFHDFGPFRLKWESHAEFATFTFAERPTAETSLEELFASVPLRHLPPEWLSILDGTLIVAAHLLLDGSELAAEALAETLRCVFPGDTRVGSRVLLGGEIWTDFQIQADGFSRFIIRDVGLRDQQAGRLVQRILEIETYRMMALLGLPNAQQSMPILNSIENDLSTLAAVMVEIDAGQTSSATEGDDERLLLHQITSLAAHTEKVSLDNSYRFSASQAYYRLVQSRIEELREQRIEGVPTVGEFMDRRLAPAMNTCATVALRQHTLADRIAQTNDLLRTRVGIVQEQQNRKILQAMNYRAAQQFKLQKAVEGLSVAAISYYFAGLFSYVYKAAKAEGVLINPDVATGVTVPLIALFVWLGLRRLHKNMEVH